MTLLNIYGLVGDTIVDGPGLRFGVFVQGCTHACPGCHNPESQPADSGTPWEVDAIIDQIMSNKIICDVTISGGEPFEQPAACAELAQKLKARGYGVWAYTGYLYEDLLAWKAKRGQSARQFLENVDVLVDGPFVESLKSYSLHWRGSSNQRVIDLQQTRDAGEIVLYQHEIALPEKPLAW